MLKAFQSLCTWLLSSLVFTVFIVPVLLAVMSALKIDNQLLVSTFMTQISNLLLRRPPGFSLASMSLQDGLKSAVLSEFHNQSLAMDFRHHYYDINNNTFYEFRQHLKDKRKNWVTYVNNSNYLVQTAPFYFNHSKFQQRLTFATRCRLHISTKRTVNELLDMLASSRHVSLLLPVKTKTVYPPIYGFEWFNGSMEVYHLPLTGLRRDFRMELIALKSVENATKTIIYRSIIPGKDDVDYIEANSFNFRNVPIAITSDNTAQHFLGLTIVLAKSKQAQDGLKEYHIKLFRYSTDMQRVAWLDWLMNTYLFCPALHAKLNHLISAERTES